MIHAWNERASDLAVKLANADPGQVREVIADALRQEYGYGYSDGYRGLKRDPVTVLTIADVAKRDAFAPREQIESDQ